MSKKIFALALGGVLTLGLTACAQGGGTAESGAEFPAPGKNFTMLVGFDAGGSTDVGARLLAKALEKQLDATITVENRPGAGGQVMYTALSKEPADGYTFGTVNLPSLIQSIRTESRGATYTLDDFEPLANLVIDPLTVVVAADSPYQNMTDLIEAATANPRTLKVSTTGVGGGDHLGVLALEEATDAEFSAVHFPEGEPAALAAFQGGHVDVFSGNAGVASGLVDQGAGRMIGVFADDRSALFPDVPTVQEQGIETSVMPAARGFILPAGVPEDVTTKLSDAIGEAVQDEAFKTSMVEQGLDVVYMNAPEFGTFMDEMAVSLDELMALVEEK